MNKLHWSSEYLNECPVSQQSQQHSPQSYMKIELEQQPMMYPVSPFYASHLVHSPSTSPISHGGMMYSSADISPSNFSSASSPSFGMTHQPGSPDSFMSGLSTPIYQHHPTTPQLVQSTSSSTTSSAATAYLNETIAKASALPESFYPEFLQYSKESFEQPASQRGNNNTSSSNSSFNNKKRSRATATADAATCQYEDEEKNKFSSSGSSSEDEDDVDESRPCRKQKIQDSDDGSTSTLNNNTVTELRRQIHIQSEQKRRAQIKDGFEDLRSELPACLNKKMSKVTLLHRTVQHIQHLKSTQMTILAELERLVQENEQLRSFQQGVLQKQALENMYSIGNI